MGISCSGNPYLIPSSIIFLADTLIACCDVTESGTIERKEFLASNSGFADSLIASLGLDGGVGVDGSFY